MASLIGTKWIMSPRQRIEAVWVQASRLVPTEASEYAWSRRCLYWVDVNAVVMMVVVGVSEEMESGGVVEALRLMLRSAILCIESSLYTL